MTALGAAVLAALAGWLLVDPLAGVRRARTPSARGLRTACLALPIAVAIAVLLLAPEAWLLAGIAGAAAWAAGVLVERARGRRTSAVVAARVRETCEQLAADLDAGQPPGTALDRAAGDWGELAPVAAAFHLGGDVPDALRELAQHPGAGDLRLVGGAWQVGQHSGHGLARALGRVAEGLRAGEGTRRLVASELASARATARLLAGLPLLALVMGSGIGGNPWAFLLATLPGLACLGAGLGLALLGLAWIERMAGEIEAL